VGRDKSPGISNGAGRSRIFFFSKTLRSVTSNVAPVATDLSEKKGGASEQPANLFPHISLEASLERIANGKANAENFEKIVRAIEEGDKKVETARYAYEHIHMNFGVGYW
jgi:hypothetical protein